MPADHGVQRSCKACGRNIWILKGPNGKPIPLDMDEPVYDVVVDSTGSRATKVNSYVSHFKTCTDPNRFSGKEQKPPEQKQEALSLEGGFTRGSES